MGKQLARKVPEKYPLEVVRKNLEIAYKQNHNNFSSRHQADNHLEQTAWKDLNLRTQVQERATFEIDFKLLDSQIKLSEN